MYAAVYVNPEPQTLTALESRLLRRSWGFLEPRRFSRPTFNLIGWMSDILKAVINKELSYRKETVRLLHNIEIRVLR